jgi:hypothetical protein
MEQRKHAGPPPNGEEKREMGTDNGGAGVTWRAVIDWIVRGALMLMIYFLSGLRSDMKDLRGDVTDVRIDLAAVVQANQSQSAEILTTRETDVALMQLLNEVTTNVAMLTERVNALGHRVEQLEEE